MTVYFSAQVPTVCREPSRTLQFGGMIKLRQKQKSERENEQIIG